MHRLKSNKERISLNDSELFHAIPLYERLLYTDAYIHLSTMLTL